MAQQRLLQRSRRNPAPPAPLRPHAPKGWLRRNGMTASLFAITILGIGYCASGLIAQQERLAKVQAEANQAGSYLGEVLNENQALEEEIKRLQTDEYVEVVARRKLGLIKPGEIPFTPVAP